MRRGELRPSEEARRGELGPREEDGRGQIGPGWEGGREEVGMGEASVDRKGCGRARQLLRES